ncbi:MAG: hypothetical protein AB3N24_18145 [Leisingera sp.]
MTLIYHYHPDTGELRGQNEARLDPLDKQPLIPAFATDIEPPEPQEGMGVVFDGQVWAQAEDHRGKVLWTAEGVEEEITGLGPLPAGLLTEKPALPVYPNLAIALAAMLDWINAFAAALDAGKPEIELRSLPAKAAAARAHLVGSASAEQTALLQSEADLTGETLDALAAEIKANADLGDLVSGKISGLRRNLKQQLEAEADPVAYEAILALGKQQALTMAGELGIALPG